MSVSLDLTGYDLSDEGPGRTVNEDATLLRSDLGLFAVADGAGGRGRGDVAANFALRTLENYIGSTVRRSHARPDYDLLGTPEEARRLSAAVHQAHQNILEVVAQDPKRKDMATTIVALLFAARTRQVHIAHVGDSRCYRMRHGRLERLTVDDTIATEILQLRPDTPDEVLDQLPRNSVVRALGMREGFRVCVTSHDVIPGDRFLLCSDGLTSFVGTVDIWETMRRADPASVLASELLSRALAARSQDNISVVVLDCQEQDIDDAVETRRYHETLSSPPSAPSIDVTEGPNSALLRGPEVLQGSLLEALEDFETDSEQPTFVLRRKQPEQGKRPAQEPTPAMDTESPLDTLPANPPPSAPSNTAYTERALDQPNQERPNGRAVTLSIDDIEFDSDDELDLEGAKFFEAATKLSHPPRTIDEPQRAADEPPLPPRTKN